MNTHTHTHTHTSFCLCLCSRRDCWNIHDRGIPEKFSEATYRPSQTESDPSDDLDFPQGCTAFQRAERSVWRHWQLDERSCWYRRLTVGGKKERTDGRSVGNRYVRNILSRCFTAWCVRVWTLWRSVRLMRWFRHRTFVDCWNRIFFTVGRPYGCPANSVIVNGFFLYHWAMQRSLRTRARNCA